MMAAKQVRGTMVVGLAMGLMVAGSMSASARVFYRNTFDADGDNVRLGDDSTDPTEFFAIYSYYHPNELTAGTFDEDYTNHGAAAASGTHARYIDATGTQLSGYHIYSRVVVLISSFIR